MRYLRAFPVVLSVLVVLAAPASAQTPAQPSSGGYTAPAEFMDLFFDFTGSGEPGYPAGQPTLGQMLTQAVAAKQAGSGAPGPLVLVVGSEIYVYDSASGRRLSEERFRADRASGFYELTARPVRAYLGRMVADDRVADDLLQETYYRFLRATVTFESDDHRRNYLFRIATNLIQDHRRRPLLEVAVATETQEALAAPGFGAAFGLTFSGGSVGAGPPGSRMKRKTSAARIEPTIGPTR